MGKKHASQYANFGWLQVDILLCKGHCVYYTEFVDG